MSVVEALPVEGKGHKAPDLLLWRSSVQDYVRNVLLVYACFALCLLLTAVRLKWAVTVTWVTYA